MDFTGGPTLAALSTDRAPLTEFYIGPIQEQLNNATPLLQRLRKTSEYIRGIDLTAQVPLHYQRATRGGWRAEQTGLPAAGRRRHQYTEIPMRYYYQRVEFTGQSMVATASNIHSFVSTVTDHMEGAGQGSARELNAEFWGDGTGRLVSIVSTGALVPIGVSVDLVAGFPASRIDAGMTVDLDSTLTLPYTGAALLGRIISDVDIPNNQISFTTAVDLTAFAAGTAVHVFLDGSKGQAPVGIRVGLDGFDSAGVLIQNTFQNINRTAAGNEFFTAFIREEPGGAALPLTLDLIQELIDTAENRGAGRATCIATNYPLRRRYLDLAQAQRRYIGELATVRGFQTLVYQGGAEPLPWFVDRDVQFGDMYVMDERSFALYRAADFNWMDLDGAVLQRMDPTAGGDGYFGILFAYLNLGFIKPNSNAVARNVV